MLLELSLLFLAGVFGGVLNSVAGLISRLMPDASFVEPLEELFGAAASWALGVGVVTLLFRYLTDADVPWPSALVGGAVTAGVLALTVMPANRPR